MKNQRIRQSYIVIMLVLMISFISCSETPKLEKPFIIISTSSYKSIDMGIRYEYVYQDAYGNREYFHTSEDIYSVGDTLK